MTDKPVSERATVSEKAELEYFMLTLPAIHCAPGICRTCRDWIEREYRKLADRVEEAEHGKEWFRGEHDGAVEEMNYQIARAEKAEREVEIMRRTIGDSPLCADHRDKIRGTCLACKLERVRDALKYQSNSDGGLVAEIDAAIRGGDRE